MRARAIARALRSPGRTGDGGLRRAPAGTPRERRRNPRGRRALARRGGARAPGGGRAAARPRPGASRAARRTGLAREIAVACRRPRPLRDLGAWGRRDRGARRPRTTGGRQQRPGLRPPRRAGYRGRRPWLADCNDFWSRNPDRTNGRCATRSTSSLERVTLAGATRLTAVNDEIRDELHRRHRKPVATLRSGFDPADFPPPRPDRNGRPVELLSAGTLYPDHDLSGLLGALARGRRGGAPAPGRRSA